jgi:hypothetical protein
VTLVALLLATVGACGANNPARPVNHNPITSSVVLFPEAIGPSDSAVVVCTATDPDGDSLLYDWIADRRLRIKDAPDGAFLFNSRSPSQIFYYNDSAPIDTAWIKCFTRDRRSGSDGRMVFLKLHS